MRLLNLNVCINKDNTENVIDLIYQTNADICTFQEVMNAFDKSCFEMYDVKSKLERVNMYDFNTFAPLYVAKSITKNGVVIRDFGGYAEQGSFLLSKYKILTSKNEFYYNKYKFEYDVSNFKKEDWCRSIQNVIVEVDGREMQIINVHGIWTESKKDDERTLAQSDFILSKLRNDIPAIVVGDFNLLPETESIKKLNKHLRNLVFEYNISVSRPPFKDDMDHGDLICDYVFVNDKVNVDNFRIINNSCSDHYPYVLDFHI